MSLLRCVDNIKRLDEEGKLYYMEYVKGYHNPVTVLYQRMLRSPGCSSFLTHTADGNVLSGRNYDQAHKDAAGNPSGVNAVLRLSPRDGYRSLNMVDIFWLGRLHCHCRPGMFEEIKVPKLPLMLLPFLTMDGINEKGLMASILALDLKEGEYPAVQRIRGRKTMTINSVLRNVLDKCATVDEALKLIESVNYVSTMKKDLHLFISDETGRSVVCDWRYDELHVTETDAVTNFYVSFDDAEDSYRNGKLKEKFDEPEPRKREYHYGYGHGYHRHYKLTAFLERHMTDENNLYTVMDKDEARDLLKEVSQGFDVEDGTSYTQYSSLYDNTDRTLDVWSQRDYDRKYSFKV